ncbi:hypothetical protein [Neptunomonas sp. XY-337]|uniref:hypothetical protein n=1 Tax=Neptunomonas sp. XY-337 TaxID=2561897 RepID=UPI0010AA356A|nr:hypothetical protein [Neptunomonas sp. XY-337]
MNKLSFALATTILATSTLSNASSYEKVSASLDFIEIKEHWTDFKFYEIASKVGPSMVEITIEPTQLGYTDGKGIVIRDSLGKEVFFSINDGHSAILYDMNSNSTADSTDEFPIVLGEKYRFFLNIDSNGIQASYLDNNAIRPILGFEHALLPPFTFKLATQRTGAKYYDVLITSQ